MGKNSKIEWTHHTFNPWWGCTRISSACTHCYAEAWAKRVGQQVWGPKASRRFFGDAHWSGPLKWNQEAVDRGERARVFCASMADVFEGREDLNEARDKLWELIHKTSQLDWLLLTKRPERILEMVPWTVRWPDNVWIGTTVEDQASAEKRLPYLAQIPAIVKFISAEPLLSELDVGRWFGTIDWVITGGESGPHARPSSPSWFRNLRSQCVQAGIPFHFKQWGDWAPEFNVTTACKIMRQAEDGTLMFRLGKKTAGRLLDGVPWDDLPKRRMALKRVA